jgi:hypothetical protein
MKPFAVMTIALTCLSAIPVVRAQSPRTRVAGRSSTGTLALDQAKRVSTETVALTFGGDASASTFTVEFTARLGLNPSASPPDVVDITVTQFPAEDQNQK